MFNIMHDSGHSCLTTDLFIMFLPFHTVPYLLKFSYLDTSAVPLVWSVFKAHGHHEGLHLVRAVFALYLTFEDRQVRYRSAFGFSTAECTHASFNICNVLMWLKMDHPYFVAIISRVLDHFLCESCFACPKGLAREQM